MVTAILIFDMGIKYYNKKNKNYLYTLIRGYYNNIP